MAEDAALSGVRTHTYSGSTGWQFAHKLAVVMYKLQHKIYTGTPAHPSQLILNYLRTFYQRFLTCVVALECYRAVASAVGAAGKPQLVLCS